MAKCECCGVREADTRCCGSDYEDANMCAMSSVCHAEAWAAEKTGGDKAGRVIAARIRARRAALAAEPTTPAPPPACQQCGELMRDHDAGHCKAKHCRECSRPERPVMATHGELCVYCDERSKESMCDRYLTDCYPANVEARERLAAFDKRNAPRQTAESRELAKPHPWECDE